MKLQMIDPDRMEVPPRPLRLRVRGSMPIPYGNVVNAARLMRIAMRKLASTWRSISESQR